MSYKPAISIDLVLEEGKIFLLRRSNKTTEETFSEVGTLKEDAIELEQIPNLSLNLLGGYFKESHLIFSPKKEARNRWNGESKVYFMDFKNLYEVYSIAVPIFFDAEGLHKKTFPYYREAKDEALKKLVLDLKPVKENGKYKFEGAVYIRHDPTNLNYWHVELVMIDAAGQKIKNANSAWVKNAAEAVSHFITGCALPENPSIHLIDSKIYARLTK